MLGAYDAQGQLIGTIAFRAYDGRFARLAGHLAPAGGRVVEVVRLFVLPPWRRAGVAGALVAALTDEARARGVRLLYLHTQAFLDGALAFWQSQGFGVIDREADPLWQTIHMARDLRAQRPGP
jgi:GNAT superfamily N-acetyltransferase